MKKFFCHWYKNLKGHNVFYIKWNQKWISVQTYNLSVCWISFKLNKICSDFHLLHQIFNINILNQTLVLPSKNFIFIIEGWMDQISIYWSDKIWLLVIYMYCISIQELLKLAFNTSQSILSGNWKYLIGWFSISICPVSFISCEHCYVNSICDRKTDDLHLQSLKYNTVIS